MSLDSCLFAVHCRTAACREAVDGRIRRLSAFYAAAGLEGLTVEWRWGDRLALGGIGPSAARGTFGQPLPAGWDAAALCSASDARLRGLPGAFAHFAAEGDRARVVAAASGPIMLYRGAADSITCWSTHAVAAAWLGAGTATLDPEVLPLYVATDFVGGDRTMVRQARACPPATVVDLTPGGATERSWASDAERWLPVPEREARAHASRALLEHVDAALGGEPACLALTGGLDSRVVAAALVELRTPWSAFTWGEPGWPDVDAAADLARRLGAAHGVEHAFDPSAPRRLDALRAHAVWHDGVGPFFPFGEQRWPAHPRRTLTGAGGEVGRAFWYRLTAGHYREPGVEQLARLVRFDRGLAGDAAATVRAESRRWFHAAAATGVQGYAILDVVYAEQRLRHWGRSMLARVDRPVVPAFASVEVLRGLASLPLADKVTDGFHRHFLAERGLVAADSEARLPRAMVPPVARRAAALLRRRRSDAPPWGFDPLWPQQPEVRAWLEDAVLAWERLPAVFGARWAEDLASGFAAGEGPATETVLRLAAPAALEASLAGLRR